MHYNDSIGLHINYQLVADRLLRLTDFVDNVIKCYNIYTS